MVVVLTLCQDHGDVVLVVLHFVKENIQHVLLYSLLF